jgi:putative ABC transport system substrate-binding protein
MIAALGGAMAWPLTARAQQATVPVIGVLTSLSSAFMARYLPPFHDGLNEAGYSESRNVRIEYRSAEGHYDRLPGLMTELIDHKPAVIVAVGGSDPAKEPRQHRYDPDCLRERCRSDQGGTRREPQSAWR